MAQIYNSITEIIGNTPMLWLQRLADSLNLEARILAKLEYLNPGGSVKDRIALAMIEAAEKNGELGPGGTIIEPTSGNTGIGLAAIAAARGYNLVITMPEIMSIERRKLMAAYGARIILTPAREGMKGAIERAESLVREIPNSLLLGQFTNPANPQAHFQTTGPEIWEATSGQLDYFIAGVGTGGTISGTGKYLKTKNPAIKILAVEPATSPVLAGGKPATHKIQGIGAGFIPKTLDTTIIDEIIGVSDANAVKGARLLARTEGVLTGFSGGAAIWATIDTAKKYPESIIATVLPDSGERYLSTPLHDSDSP